MLSFKRFSAIAALVAIWIAPFPALAQPALTTIQDILYRADGTRFSGTMFIRWNSFTAGDTSNIATAFLELPIVNGSLLVRLVPTTTAAAGAQYNVTYNSNGVNQFTEIWAVPPSSLTLRVRDVRISTGTVVGPAPVITPIQISDVVGLQNELAVRPMEGVGFAIGRAAIINQVGQIDGASGLLSDCVHVDGSAGQCGGSGGGGFLGNFADSEVPAGLVNGVNTVFSLAFPPSPAASLSLYRNGLLQESGTDYTISGSTITFLLSSAPQASDLLLASYRYANPNNPFGSLAAAQVVCSSVGLSTTGLTSSSLGSCTLPAALLRSGDRLEIQAGYAHTGSTAGFSAQVNVGGTAVAARSGAASDSLLTAHITFGISMTGQQWDTLSWGSGAVAFQAVAGTASENITQALTIDFRGQMNGTGTDSVVLNNFTVLHYPAQSN